MGPQTANDVSNDVARAKFTSTIGKLPPPHLFLGEGGVQGFWPYFNKFPKEVA